MAFQQTDIVLTDDLRVLQAPVAISDRVKIAPQRAPDSWFRLPVSPEGIPQERSSKLTQSGASWITPIPLNRDL